MLLVRCQLENPVWICQQAIKRPQSVEQIALDSKVAVQERAEAPLGKKALPILARCGHVPQCSSLTQAYSRVVTLGTGNMRGRKGESLALYSCVLANRL